MARDIDACADLLQQRFGPEVLCGIVSLDTEHATLLPEERAFVAQAVPARRREFAAGRACARELLARLGFASAPLVKAPDRLPRWPEGAVGSIAHSAALCAVAVARAGRLRSVGLDTEPDEPLEEDLWSTICTRRELEALSHGPRGSIGRTVRVVFSAKESVYKCLYPITHTALEFHDVEIEFDSPTNSFRARVRGSRECVLQGFHLACAGSLFTGATLPGH